MLCLKRGQKFIDRKFPLPICAVKIMKMHGIIDHKLTMRSVSKYDNEKIEAFSFNYSGIAYLKST